MWAVCAVWAVNQYMEQGNTGPYLLLRTSKFNQVLSFSFYLVVSFSMNNSASIQILTRSNYKKWKRDVDFSLRIMDLDLYMCEDQPTAPTDASTTAQRNFHAQWEKSNHLSLIVMDRSIFEHLLSCLPETTNAKEFLTNVGKLYDTGENVETGSLMDEIQTIKYDETKGVRDFILKIVNV
ncbi:uncharacterized protein LOC133780322 [Humulus lupulus]|uniref:uncharacterized protein LOC133780322 n=1 Tax=Humulus lupulus TaxID=3486 RepID=UPI002B412DEE|nr:uncharacterized protein LOC133780322 [Humulus lupulus]